MLFNNFRARIVALIFGGAAIAAMVGFGSGHASATTCSASSGQQVQHVVGKGGCGAKAGAGSWADAEDSSNAGTAVAVADKGGQAMSRNLQPGSTALAGANTQGHAYSLTTGPGALSVAQARQGGTTVAIGGWGGQAVSGPSGSVCQGGFATVYDSTTGKACLRSGTMIDWHN